MAKSNKKHIGKALLNIKKSKGSVLFLVVAIMSVMVILASALYYSMSTARRQVEVKYDSQQAYQSALALNDFVVNFINIRNEDAFVQSIIDLEENGTLVTKSDDGSGFSELAGGLGDYKVTINKIEGKPNEEIHVLEIEVSIDVNGENSTISTIGEFKVQSKPYNFDRFFTSTGYAPNDVIFKNMKNDGETIYLDNEYTQFGGSGANDVTTKSAELISAGTVRFESPSMVQNTEFTIGNNCYILGQNGFSFPIARVGGTVMANSNGGNVGGGPLYVLGDLYTPRQSMATVAYVNGDAYYSNSNPPSHMYYINGDLFFEKDCMPNAGNFVVGGNTYCYGDDSKAATYANYCNGKVYNLKSGNIVAADGTTESIANGSINALIVDTYMKFDLGGDPKSNNTDEEIRDGLDYIETHCGAKGGAWANVWPSLDGTCEDIVTVKQRINEKIGNPEYINWDLEAKFYTMGFVNGMPAKVPAVDSSKIFNLQLTNDAGTVIKATTANDYYILENVSGGSSRSSVIFDTFMGDYNDPTEVADKSKYANMYIYLEPNCYFDGSTIKTDDPTKFDSFSWDTTGWGAKFVFVRGMGSVNFIIPDGVRYVQPENGYLGHIAMFEKMTNSTIPVTNNGGVLTYGQCPLDRMPTGVEGNIRSILTSNSYGTTHLLPETVINEYNNPNNPARAFYIHNNVFIATISKNAIMDFSGGQNLYSGFVYAPYMTYNSEGVYSPAQSGMIGGMIVSDFIQSSQNDNYVCMIPYDYYDRYVNSADSAEEKEKTRTRYMEKLMADSGCTQILTSSTSRTWRKFGYN